VAPHDFQFSLALSDEPFFDRMLTDLVSAVLGHVGYAPDATTELAGVVRGVLADRCRGDARCRIRFVARDGELQIGIAQDGAPEWRTSRPLP
jgi:hypothetical protein